MGREFLLECTLEGETDNCPGCFYGTKLLLKIEFTFIFVGQTGFTTFSRKLG